RRPLSFPEGFLNVYSYAAQGEGRRWCRRLPAAPAATQEGTGSTDTCTVTGMSGRFLLPVTPRCRRLHTVPRPSRAPAARRRYAAVAPAVGQDSPRHGETPKGDEEAAAMSHLPEAAAVAVQE